MPHRLPPVDAAECRSAMAECASVLSERKKVFFFEKKKQKTFDCWYEARRQRAQRVKSFLVPFLP
jgi:hypothetical protein